MIEYSPARNILIPRTYKYVSRTTYSISFSVYNLCLHYILHVECRLQRSIEIYLNFRLISSFFSLKLYFS